MVTLRSATNPDSPPRTMTQNRKTTLSRNRTSALLISALVVLLLELASQAPTASSASLAMYSSSDLGAMQEQLPWRTFPSKQSPASIKRNILGAPDFGRGERYEEKMPRSSWHQQKSTNLFDYTKDEDAEIRQEVGNGEVSAMSKRGFNVIPRFINHLTSVPGRKLMGLQQRSSWSSEDGFSGYSGGRGGPRQFRLRWG